MGGCGFPYHLLCAATAGADGLTDVGTVKRVMAGAMAKARVDAFSDFFRTIKPFWLVADEGVRAARDKTIAARKGVRAKMGASLGVELVRTDMVSDDLFRLVYVEKFERSVLIWNFYFYKPHRRWFLSTFEWEDNVRTLFR